jgi:hypothetical protein
VAVYEITIDVGDDEVIEQDVELDGIVYTFRFAWNTRDESWSLSVLLPSGEGLAMGRKVVLGVPLLRGEIDSRLPPGMLVAVDTTEQSAEPGRYDLGKRVIVSYFDADEVPA